MRTSRSWIVLGLAGAASLALLWFTKIPLGIPGEWTWSRIAVPPDARMELALGWVFAGLAGGAYVALAALGASQIERLSRGQTAIAIAVLSTAGFAYLWVVQESPPGEEHEMAKSAWVLYFRGTEGYFEQARSMVQDVPSYLAGYEAEMAKGDVLHLGTHPPGMILFHRMCIEMCTSSRGLRDLLLRSQPATFRGALDEIEAADQPRGRIILPAERAALWLAALLTQAVAAATVAPLYLLVRRDHSRTISWWTASLWPLVPALAIFLPKSDAFFPFLGAIFLWTWLEGIRRRSPALAATAGAILWLAMFLSLAILPVVLAAGLLTIWELVMDRSRHPRFAGRLLVSIAIALGVWLLLVLLLRVIAQINLLAVWRWNYRNHAAFYTQYPRTYWKWLLVNPLEMFFALGAPVSIAALLGFRSLRGGGWRQAAGGPYVCLTATWLILWLSGKNMGEAARLWLVIFPWPVWLAAGFIASLCAPPVRSTSTGHVARQPSAGRAVLLLVLLQLIINIGTVTRVTGFDF